MFFDQIIKPSLSEIVRQNQQEETTRIIETKSAQSFSNKNIHILFSANNNNANSRTIAPMIARPWCNSTESDYCPLVIAFMSFIIITSLVLIIFLCFKTSIRCKKLRQTFQKIFRSRSQSSQRRSHRLNRSTNSQIFNISSNAPTTVSEECGGNQIQIVSSTTNTDQVEASLLARLGRRFSFRRSSNNSNIDSIWYTDLSKRNGQLPPPPPSYDESQNYTKIMRHCYPRKYLAVAAVRRPNNTASIVNNAFSMENVCENYQIDGNNQASVFPNYRYLSLTTSPSTQATLSRLGNLSRQLLREHNEDIISANIATMASFLDEVPPPYEAVVTTNHETPRRHLNRTRSFMSSLLSSSFRSQQRQTPRLPSYNSLTNSNEVIRENLV